MDVSKTVIQTQHSIVLDRKNPLDQRVYKKQKKKHHRYRVFWRTRRSNLVFSRLEGYHLLVACLFPFSDRRSNFGRLEIAPGYFQRCWSFADFCLKSALGRGSTPTPQTVGDVGRITGGRDAVLEDAVGGDGSGVVGTRGAVVGLRNVARGFLVDQAGETGAGGGASSCVPSSQ
jgi:hypothetical protein